MVRVRIGVMIRIMGLGFRVRVIHLFFIARQPMWVMVRVQGLEFRFRC